MKLPPETFTAIDYESRKDILGFTHEQMFFFWGEKCLDYEPGCAACQAWAVWDNEQARKAFIGRGLPFNGGVMIPLKQVDTVSTKKLVTRLDQMEEIDWVMFRVVAQMVGELSGRMEELSEEQDRIMKWMDAHYSYEVQRTVINILTDELMDIEANLKCPK